MNTNQMNTQAEYLELANNMLERYDCLDNPQPGIFELTGHEQTGMTTSSGLNDHDYRDLDHLAVGQKNLTQVKALNRIQIPTEILDHFNHIKCHCMMGLFPEIGRAYLTIDSEIYIWTYEHTRDVAYYDGLSQLITGVGIIKPKPKVFIKKISHLLVLCTAVDIVMLGITFDTGRNQNSQVPKQSRLANKDKIFEELHLMPKPVFSVGTDGNPITVIKGTKNGRIFLGGKDGCLYEITYKAETTWFGSRCKMVNHSQSLISIVMPNFLKAFLEPDPIVDLVVDNDRNLLYVLTEKGCIEPWDLGPDGNNIRRICRVSYSDIAFNVGMIIRTIDPAAFKTVKALCVIAEGDCPDVNIMAVTQCGVRLYFSTLSPTMTHQHNMQVQQNQMRTLQNRALQMTQSTCLSPNSTPPNLSPTSNKVSLAEFFKHQGLYLRHVRLPPGYTPNSTMTRPKEIHFAFYKDGTTLMASSSQQDQDVLWSISSTPFSNKTYLTETTTLIPLDGVVYDIAEVRDYTKKETSSIIRKAKKSRKVIVLTNEGAYTFNLLKPVDILQQLLYSNQGPHHDNIKVFFHTLSESEACATCLLLACSEEHQGTEIALWAAQAFMLYGGDPYYHSLTAGLMQNSPRNTLDRSNAQMYVSTPVQQGNSSPVYRSPQTPLQTGYQQLPLNPMSNAASSINEPKVIVYSYRHDGLYLHVCRLLRPIWKKKCIRSDSHSSISLEDCTNVLHDLTALKIFFETNSINDLAASIIATYPNQSSLNNYTNGYRTLYPTNNLNAADQRLLTEQAQAEEKRSLISLNYFIKYVCEGFALWKILLENHFPAIIKDLTRDAQITLRNITFREFVLARSDMCRLLIISLINTYLMDKASVNAISQKLRQQCPNMYRHEDAVQYKATQLLIDAKGTKATDEKEEKLHMALKLCKDATSSLPLQGICHQFTLAGFYKGVIELCSTMAAKKDPEEYGIHYYKSDEPTDDRDGCTAYIERKNVYKEVQNMLDYVHGTACAIATEKSKNPMTSHNVPEENVTNEMLGRIITKAIKTKDPVLHVCIYEWLLSHDMVGELLSLSDPSLGEYLRRNVMRNPKDYKLIDLLWKYYEKNGHHIDAAKILNNLATLESDDVNLEKRIEYLARAVMCMRNESLGDSVANGILLKELEDRLEIARVQKSILEALKAISLTRPQVLKAVEDLNRSLFDISNLYEHFADPFNLWECKLRILNCSNHNDPLLIESVWTEIINMSLDGCGSTSEQCIKLFTKMDVLFKEFKDSGHCFPLAFLIKYLEMKACQLRFPAGIVPEKLFELNVDIELLMEYYLRMISMNERVWTSEGNEWHLIDSAIHVVGVLCKNLHLFWNRNKRRILLKGQDVVSSCLTLLFQKPGTDRLQQDLKEIQYRLQRALA